VRLACPKMYCILVGFYYAKWLEKLDYYLRNSLQRERSSSTRTPLTPTPTPIKQTYFSIASSSAVTPSSERQTLMEKRAAIFEDKADEELTSMVTLAGYCVLIHSTVVPAIVPKTNFAPSEKIQVKELLLSNGRGCAGKRGKRGT
jgi:hypothetical protein